MTDQEFEGFEKHMAVCEAFLRRAAAVDLPFMLKGSFVTRQYMKNPEIRLPNDVDFVYLLPLSNAEEAGEKFSEWAIRVTEQREFDGVHFQNFRENNFWRRVDYAMSDDFPTVNTDIAYGFGTEYRLDYRFSFDLSFNLPLDYPPMPLLYQPLKGKPFWLNYTAPLSLQVAWKLHQTLTRPRFKDLFDLMHLVSHESFDDITRFQCLQALVNECHYDKVDVQRLALLLEGNWGKLFKNIEATWQDWRHYNPKIGTQSLSDLAGGGMAFHILRDTEILPKHLNDFKKIVISVFENAGFTLEIFTKLPKPILKR